MEENEARDNTKGGMAGKGWRMRAGREGACWERFKKKDLNSFWPNYFTVFWRNNILLLTDTVSKCNWPLNFLISLELFFPNSIVRTWFWWRQFVVSLILHFLKRKKSSDLVLNNISLSEKKKIKIQITCWKLFRFIYHSIN